MAVPSELANFATRACLSVPILFSRSYKQNMKKIITLAVVAIAALIALPQGAEAKKKNSGGDSKIEFVATSHDFGTIMEKNGPVSCEFEFTNTGTAPLVIFDVTAQCGCTRPEYPKKPIAPGAKGKVKVTYNPAGRPGAFLKTVTVKCNTVPRSTALKIKGTVVPKDKK